MRHITITATAAVAVIAVQVLFAQTAMKPTVPATAGEPAWQGIVPLSDGRTFVTDGGLGLDAALAKPAKLPDRVLAAKVPENYLNASHKDEYGFSDLTAVASSKTYTSPSGIALNATYINFLRRVLPADSVCFRMAGELQPVVILANGRAVGVLMPAKQ